ncbi:MAG: apolipoprotein N-acyltransferase [Leptospirales bacterium]|nr:apolipoprotein N-acyltransferase [Leptospirales bacterium]
MKAVSLPDRSRLLVGITASAILSGLFLHSGFGWFLGFVAFVPWLLVLNEQQTLVRTLLSAYAMCVAFTLAVFAWLGVALGNYIQIGGTVGLIVLVLIAPLFQPQFLAFALARKLVSQRSPLLGIFAGAAAWVGAEWLLPRLLDDTISYGLYPSPLIRQAADLGGSAGLTFLLILSNEGIAAAFARRAQGIRTAIKPLAFAALVPLLLTIYGVFVLSTSRPSGQPLRIALIQSNLTHYEQQREEKGAYEFVREVLDTHFAMTHEAVTKQQADAVLWSETAYPTTFGHPKSEAGRELDNEIQRFVNSAGIPFVIGTYDLDAEGEYNAAAFIEPQSGLLGFYRKTRLFPMTEYVPAWLDGPFFRRWFPWTGTWKPGSGARVFPLRLADGREIPVLASICLDDVDTNLTVQGARMGAQAILTMSNDSWFTEHEMGAEMHHFVAAFRSIETRLPQFRVTTNGYSAVIDANGTVVDGSRLGERTLVVANAPVGTPPKTLMVILGNWVGPTATAFLAFLAALVGIRRLNAYRSMNKAAAPVSIALPTSVSLVSRRVRFLIGLLHAFARCGVIVLGVTMLLDSTLTGITLTQIKIFVAACLIPEALARLVRLIFSAQSRIENGTLVLTRWKDRFEIPLAKIAAVEPWRLPIPGAGFALRLSTGETWQYDLTLANPAAFSEALAAAGSKLSALPPSTVSHFVEARMSNRPGLFDHPIVKFMLLSCALAIPAFVLHQNIGYGSAFGEYFAFGLKAYLLAFAIWWAAWAIGVVLIAATLRTGIEIGTLLSVVLRPAKTVEIRTWLEGFGLIALYVGTPTWLIFRIFGS